MSKVSQNQPAFVPHPRELGTVTAGSRQIAGREALLPCRCIRLLLLRNCPFHFEGCGPFVFT